MGRPKKTVWRRIADSRVRHVWKLACPCATQGGTMVGGEVALPSRSVRRLPAAFCSSRRRPPACSMCGNFMVYSHTEVLKPRWRCTVSAPDENRRVPY